MNSYAQKVLANALDSVRQSVKGNRNATLSKAAYGVARVVHLGLDPHIAAQQLIEAALAVGLLHSEAITTVRSAFAKGQLNPKDLDSNRDVNSIWSTAPAIKPAHLFDQAQANRLQALWRGAKPLTPGDAVYRYLSARGLAITPPPSLRLAWFDYWEAGQRIGRFPVMLAQVVHPTYGLVALHRTYLDPSGQGKASVPSPKKLTRAVFEGAVMGGAIQLYPSTHRLALAEGIETALAVRQGLQEEWPVWATVSATGLERAILPQGVQEVSIWADHDEAGLAGANKAAGRFVDEGRRVKILTPETPGADWLDVLQGGGQ